MELEDTIYFYGISLFVIYSFNILFVYVHIYHT